jgi:ubiquinone/menaquinone biosynthesis C-methylase UbiE
MFGLPKKSTSNWDRVAKEYDSLVGETGDFNHITYINPVILGILGNVKNYNILDLACGQGYFSKILHSKGAHVVGVDISEKLIKIAEEKFSTLGIKFLVRDAANMEGVASNQFDYVVCNMSFHDIEHVSETIDEISRVIQIGGKLIFSIPHPWTHTGKTVKDGDGYYLRLDRYKSIFETENQLYGDKGIMSYHRPLEYYVKKLTDHKFEITNFVEICKEHEKGDLINDKSYLEHKKEFPSFLVVGATKNLVVY